MTYRRILIQPAKTSRGLCKNCSNPIIQNQLRIQVVDARAFKQALKKYGNGGQGASRGYFETQNGSISIQKYFVHLNCYVQIQKHPFTKEYFDTKKITKAQKIKQFEDWLQKRSNEQIVQKSKKGGKKKLEEETVIKTKRVKLIKKSKK